MQKAAVAEEPLCPVFIYPSGKFACIAWLGPDTFCPSGQPASSCFADYNGNRIRNLGISGETNYSGATADISGYPPGTTNSSGNYVFLGLPGGNIYSVRVTATGLAVTNPPNPRSVTLNSNTTVNFGLAPSTCPGGGNNTVQGVIYNDDLNNNCASGFTASPGVPLQLIDGSIGLPPISTGVTSAAGTYSMSDTLGCTNRHIIVLGKTIKRVDTGTGWSNIGFFGSDFGPFNYSTSPQTVNFCLKTVYSWYQVDTGDVRFRGLVNKIPGDNLAATHPTFPGIFFSSEWPTEFNGFSPSSRNWLVNSEYNYNSRSSRSLGAMAYTFYTSRARVKKVTVTDLFPGTSSLSRLATTGVYKYEGDMSINSSWSPFPPGAHIVLLVNGNVTISTPITVPAGQNNLFILAAKGNITVGSNVGTTPSSTYASDTTNRLEGIYTAEEDIVFGTRANCTAGTPDLRLNVGGALIANSKNPFSNSGTGEVINRRSLCAEDTTYPSLTVTTRPDFLTQLTDFYKTSIKAFREVNP